MNAKRIFILIFIGSLLTFSCKNGKMKESLLPSVSGKAGEVLIIMEKTQWDTDCGKQLRNVLLKEVDVLPQSEPMFNPICINHKAFSELFRIHRNIVITNISKKVTENKITVENDKWAVPQTIINISAKTKAEFIELFNNNEDKIMNLLLKAERDRLMQNYKKYTEQSINNKIQKRANINITVPKGYTYDMDTNNFIWISQETPQISQGVFIYWYNYNDTSMLTKDALINKRNNILQKYVSGPREGSYMTTETQIKPKWNSYIFKGNYFAELRGLWKVEGDYMGGPFVSLSLVDKKHNRIVTADGYVYAPKYDKRNYMRQVEAILYSINIDD